MLILALLACSSNAPNPDEPAPADVVIGPNGGTLSTDGFELIVPPGALDADAVLRIVDLGIAPPPPYEGLSTVWSIEPEGLTFLEPVTVRMPFQDDPYPALYWGTEDGYERLEDATFADGFATGTLDRLGRGFVAVGVETFEQVYEPLPADVLFVVDNTVGMEEHQLALASAAPVLFDTLRDAGIDFHVGVTTTDGADPLLGNGLLHAVGGERFVQSTTPDPAQLFAAMVDVGTSGSSAEKGRAASWMAIETNGSAPSNQGFCRSEASFDVVFLTNEDDQSGGDPVTRSEYIVWLQDLKASREQAHAHAMVYQPGGCAPLSNSGTEYVRYVERTFGVLGDLCAPNWNLIFEAIADDGRLFAVTLPEWPEEVVAVRLDGVSNRDLEPGDYSLVGDTLVFDQGLTPVDGDTVVVRYR